MLRWPHQIVEVPTHQALEAIKDITWQRFIESLNGLSTEKKLDKLYSRREDHILHDSTAEFKLHMAQIDHYVHSLKKVGFLNTYNRVIK